ncbi:MAG: hypothetical protein ACI36V_06615 [Coriobacteriales bacterium]
MNETAVPAQGAAADEQLSYTPEEKLQRARYIVGREPAKREQYHAALSFCRDAGDEGAARYDITAAMEHLPQSKVLFSSMGGIVDTMVRYHMLDEELPAAEFDPDTQEDFIDNAKALYRLSETGRTILGDMDPTARLDALFAQRPEYAEAFRMLLEHCSGAKRSLKELNALLDGYCSAIPNEKHVTGMAIYPNAFINKVRDAGGIVWDDGWTTTSEGEAFLAVLQ